MCKCIIKCLIFNMYVHKCICVLISNYIHINKHTYKHTHQHMCKYIHIHINEDNYQYT